MLKKEVLELLNASREQGWVLEPDAKRILSLYDIPVPRFVWARDLGAAVDFAGDAGYPVVAKVISPRILHKSDTGGVIPGIAGEAQLSAAFEKFSRMDGFAGMLVEETAPGIELMAGAKIDFQFGPVILLGMGGTGVEIYRDTALRMAPLAERDVPSMVGELKARRLIQGYRGADPVDMKQLTRVLMGFSDLVMDLREHIESIDLNPLMCSARACVAADARILLKEKEAGSAGPA
ncbi:MAG: acetyl-CoA synthetase [Deltaproteobacteria bacterium]|nr:MAG: acetyl-CoA synthetase [Deltaproteobacteria bacterium]